MQFTVDLNMGNNKITSVAAPVADTDVATKIYADDAVTNGSVASAGKLTTARTISLTGDATGSTTFDGSTNASIAVVIADDSHNHVISNVDGLQTVIDAKAPLASPVFTGTVTTPVLKVTSKYSIQYNATEDSLDFIYN